MIAEGRLEKIITFIGWLINTRRFIIALPPDKWIAWSADIRPLNDKRTVTYKESSTLISKLNHICFIIPDARYFMNNLQKMEALAQRKKKVKFS